VPFKITPSQIGNLTFFLPIWINFIFFSYLIACLGIIVLCWVAAGIVGMLFCSCLQYFHVYCSQSVLSYMFIIYSSYYVEICSFYY
jgi:hypothetical protein